MSPVTNQLLRGVIIQFVDRSPFDSCMEPAVKRHLFSAEHRILFLVLGCSFYLARSEAQGLL